MIKSETVLLNEMFYQRLIILDVYDSRDYSQSCKLTDFDRANTYDRVSMRLANRLVKSGKLKVKNTSMCLDIFENTIYLPEHEKEIFNHET